MILEKVKPPPGTKPVKFLAGSAHLLFLECGPECIDNGCTAVCCDAPSHKNGCLVTVHKSEKKQIEAHGVKVVGGYIQPHPGTKGCPFKNSNHLCDLHNTDHKPFGCIASPFMLKANDRLGIRPRYIMLNRFKREYMPCYVPKGTKGGKPAYQTFRASLDRIFGLKEAKRVCDHLDNGGGDLEAYMPQAEYKMMTAREVTLKAK